MAKRLLHNVLVKVLGEFIELDEENLNLAVWSGQIVLTNLRLKTQHILETYNLNVFHGSIRRLEVTIPWATLLVNPVRISIDGILLDVGPLDIAKLGRVEAMKRYMTEKLQKLKMVDQYLELSLNLKDEGADTLSSSSSKDTNSESYLQQWTTKIIDNIEINVTNMHIRYEDSISMPGRTFACGMTLSSFGISTSDSDWNLGANRKSTPSDLGSVYKLAYLKCLGIYWQIDATSMAGMSLKEWENVMMLYIVKEDWTLPGVSSNNSNNNSNSNSGTSTPARSAATNKLLASQHSKELIMLQSTSHTREYILSPYQNSLTLKLTQNKKPTEKRPKFDVRAESSNLQVHVDSVQYVELFSVVDRLGALGRMYKPKTYRPYDRPYNRRTCCAWWKYACKLATRSRKYTDLVKLSLRLAAGRDDPHIYLPSYAASELRYLEERLPFEPLRVARQRAMLELQGEVRKQRKLQKQQTQASSQQQAAPATSSWWGSWGSSQSPVKPAGAPVRTDEDISIESILAALNEPETVSKSAQKLSSGGDIVISMIRFSLRSSSTALFSCDFKPIVQVNSAVFLSFTKSSNGMTFQCDLQDLLVLDRHTRDPPVPYIVSVKSDLSYVQRTHLIPTNEANAMKGVTSKPTFSLRFERISGKSKVVIAALPIELCLNKECIQMVLSAFGRPENKYAEKERDSSRKIVPKKPDSALATAQMGIRNLRNVSQHSDDLEIVLEANAPKIIIPESREDSGYVLLDCGYLEVKGIVGASGMSMNVGLNKVSVGMPMTVRDMYKFGEKAIYLIKPFDILLYIQNIDQIIANMTLDVEIKPEIRGEIDSIKLARLLTALGQVSGMFTKIPIPSNHFHSKESGSDLSVASPPGNYDRESPVPTTPTVARGTSGVAVDTTTPSSIEFHTPERVSLNSRSANSSLSRSHITVGGKSGDAKGCDNTYGQFSDAMGGTEDVSETHTPEVDRQVTDAHSPSAPMDLDPTISNMRISVLLPVLALDLQYDVQNGYHLVLEVKTMRTIFVTRPLDRTLVFELGAVSMHDTFRADEQSHLAWTPPGGGSLIQISYVNLFSRKSPLYKNHATDIEMKFASLGLNVDANTIKHLRPFFEVLLGSRGGPPSDAVEQSTGISAATLAAGLASMNNRDETSCPSSGSDSSASLADEFALPPSGTSVHASLERISLDFLRVPLIEKKGALLDSAFSAQISGMRCKVNMQALTVAEVHLRSFEILDIRHSTSDYVFKKVFCPAFEEHAIAQAEAIAAQSEAELAARASASAEDLSPPHKFPWTTSFEGPDLITNFTEDFPSVVESSGGLSPMSVPVVVAERASGNEDENLLYVVYRQESKAHNHFDLVFTDLTSFIAIDTILDLNDVVLANLFAFFSLLAAPTPTQSQAQSQAPNAMAMASNLADKMFTPESKLARANSSPVDTSQHNTFENEPGSIMTVALKVRNPRLIFLEDPSSEESQAIVGTCGVEILYTRETKTGVDRSSMFDSIHITLSKYEVYVLKSMTHWYPQPILEPVEIELNIKRRIVDGVMKMMNLHIELDNIVTQVSFNDILLAQSILSRRTLSDAPPQTNSAPAGSPNSGTGTSASTGQKATPSGSPSQPTPRNISEIDEVSPASATELEEQPCVVSFQIGMSGLSMVVINDFAGLSVPIIKTTVSNSHFGVESVGPKVNGIGALDAKVDFFNPRLSVWEPILDMWQPTARIYSINDSKIFEVKSDYTMQLTVSGILLETLLRSYSLFFHDVDVLAERTALSGITVRNLLGDGVEVELYDSGSKEKLVSLSGGQSRLVTGTQDLGGKLWSKATLLPSAVDLHFSGRFKSQRLPLFHLPFNVNRPKAYNLQPAPPSEEVKSPVTEEDSVWTTKSSKVYVIEPIVEEVFENSRYDPLMGCWRKPFVMGDPHEWTDGSGTVRKDISSIALISDRWEWQGNWEIDMDGEIGKEIDQEGWEYATSFKFFTMVSVRRCSKALDGCRRRRWTRTRIPVATFTSLSERPLTLFWDVHANQNGSRNVDLRSALQIANQMSYPIMVGLQHSAWDREVELGPVEADELLSVPLIYSYASSVRVRPVYGAYEWSQTYPCSTHTYDFSTTKNGGCVGKVDSTINNPDGSVTTVETSIATPVWFRVMTTQTNKSVMVNIVPYITMTNKLLCDMRFVFIDRDGRAEEGEVESGCEKKLSFMNSSNSPMLSIKVGNFEWSERILLCVVGDSANLFELQLPGRKRSTKLYLSMNSKPCPMRGIHIEIFSKVAVIDRTSLHLFLSSRLRPGVNVVRSTCSSLRSLGDGPICLPDLPPGTVRERLNSVDSLCRSHHEHASDSDVHGAMGLSLKLPGFEGLLKGEVKNQRRVSRSHLHSADEIDTPTVAPTVANPILNTYAYRSSFPEAPTVQVDCSSVLKPTKRVQTKVGPDRRSAAILDAQETMGVELPQIEVLVKDVQVSSRNLYQLMQTIPGQRVYTDHPMRWCHLPPFLCEQLQLRTPYEDRLQRSTKLVQFSTTSQCMVFVLVHIDAAVKWLTADGFMKIREIATARSVVRGTLEEFHFAIFGKICEAKEHIVLKSCWNKVAVTMYSLFFLPISQNQSNPTTSAGLSADTNASNFSLPTAAVESTNKAIHADSIDSAQQQLQYQGVYSRELAARSWTEGGNHLSLMYTFDNMVTVGLCKGKVWGREINIDIHKNAASKGSFEVNNTETGISYQISYGLHALPGLYSETQLIYFMPRYCILNCTEDVLLVSQRGSEKYLQYQPYRPDGWHKLEVESGTAVQLRTASTLWSLGAVDINDVGSSVLFIPYRDSSSTEAVSGAGIVLHVEVKLADPTDHCSVLVIVWQETIEARVAMSIRNTSDVAVTVRQADIEMDHEIQGQEHLFEICVPAGAAVPFGWADPECGTDVLIAVGEGLGGQNKRIASINLLKTEQLLRLPYNFGRNQARGEVVISVSTNNSGHVLEISNLHKGAFLHETIEGENEGAAEIIEDIESRQRNASFPTYGFNFVLSSFGVSLVVEKPHRREFLSLYIDWLEVLLRIKGSLRSLEFVIMDLQVDNYSETMIYPVLLRSRKKEVRRSVAMGDETGDTLSGRARQESALLAAPPDSSDSSAATAYKNKQEEPFFKLTIIQEVPLDGSQTVFQYIACRVLSVEVEVDSATVQLLFTDLLDDLKILTHAQALALSMPDAWLNQFNYKQLYPQQQLRLINVYGAKIQAQQSKMYFKTLIIHPVKVTFTFAQTTFPRRQHKETLQSTVLNVLMSLVGVERLRIHLRSFEVSDAMESIRTLSDMITSKSMQDVRSQVTQIAGSLTMLGSPIGFARRVGSGVKAFFYEPYQGAVQGSGDFFLGLGRGTSTLFTGVVSGAMDSAIAIVGTASKGISHLSGDADYVRKRALKRQQSKVNRGGILEGMREGGESLISGISSGMSGLVSKPLEEASKSGIKGFFKGIGLGLIGAAVKPVLGVSDGLTSVAQGISNQVDSGSRSSHVRPPRALEPWDIDSSYLVIVPLSLEAAFAQQFVATRAKQGHYDDSFLRYIPLDARGEAIILSNIYVYWRRSSSLWGRVWANISHCVYMEDAVGIMLYSGGKNGGPSLVSIPCQTPATAKRVYAALAQNTSRMGNPSNVIPVDIVMKAGKNSTCLTPSSSREKGLHTLIRDGRRITQSTEESLRQVVDESQLGALDGYRFGTANCAILSQITGSEDDVLKRAAFHLEKPIGSWQRVDQHIWRLLWEWGCIHSNLSACRCSVTLLINRSDSPIQITRVQLLMGRNVLIFGSNDTGYEVESRSLLPEGMMVVFICAFPESPLDIGHLKANINTAAFNAVVASTQRESLCEAKGGFTIGFLEKTVSDWWSIMAIRCGYTVGRTTAESSLNDQLRIFKARNILPEEPKRSAHRPPNPAHEKLSTKCIRVVVENFGEHPVKEVIPPPQMAEITKMLPTNLSPLVGARYIYNESFWKRCCVDKYGWHNCHLHEHNLLWKQLFFEKLLQETLEDFDAVTEDPDMIYELIDAAMDYIFTLSFKQLPSHLELFEICDMLPNLTKLDINYGVKKIGMNYERMLFGMKISDATSLAKIFDHTDTLTTVILAGNMIDDDLLRMLMTGLIKNNTITHLDVSHNKITNHGARLLSKLLGENSVLTTLNLSDNQIHAEGGRYLARGLRENDSLLQLNLRLNRLTDEGCSLLLEGLRDNVNLIELNIGSNGASSQSAQILFSIVRDQEHSLQVLDISGNEFIGEHFEQMRLSMAANATLTSLDMRRNPGYDSAPAAVEELEKIVHANEHRARTSAGHP